MLIEIDFEKYNFLFSKYGGSFSCHPRVLQIISKLSNIKILYHGIMIENELVGGFPVYNNWICSSEEMLKSCDLLKYIDIGQSDLILPINSISKINLEFKASWLSSNNTTIDNMLLDSRFTVAIAKGINHGKIRMSKKKQQQRRGDIKKIIELGAMFVPINSLTPNEFIKHYVTLFHKRWNKDPHPMPAEYFATTIVELWNMLAGDILIINGEPIAMHILYAVNNPRSLDYNFVQMAVDPQYKDFSVGSALIYNNILTAEELAHTLGKTLRFCFGKSSPYKTKWCYESPVYITS